MAQTLREVIEHLNKLESYMDKPVAWTMYTEDDLEIIMDEIKTEDTITTVWSKVVDEIQKDLDYGYINTMVDDSIRTEIDIHYGYKWSSNG